MVGYMEVLAINGVIIAGVGISLCVCCYRRRAKARARGWMEVELGGGELSGAQVEYGGLMDRRCSLQPQRRTCQAARDGPEAGPSRQPTPRPVSTSAELEDGTRVEVESGGEDRPEGPVRLTARSNSTDPSAGRRGSDAGTGVSPPPLSIVIPETSHRGQQATLSGPLPPTPPSAHQQTPPRSGYRPPTATTTTPEPGPRRGFGFPTSRWRAAREGGSAGESRASTVYSDSIYPESSLPSYPGTARSASPPPYSNLPWIRWGRTAGTETGGSERGVSVYAESVGRGEPVPALPRLEGGAGDVSG